MEWVVFRNNAHRFVARTDGAETIDLGNTFTFWTKDDQLVVLDVNQVFGDIQQERTINEAYLLNLPAQTPTDLEDLKDMVFTLADFNLNTLETLLNEHNAELMPNSYGGAGVFGFPVVLLPDEDTQLWVEGTQFADNIDTCIDWSLKSVSISASEEPTEIYTTEATLGLIDFTQTAEGDIYFQRWYLENCNSQPESLRGEIVHILPDGQTEMITDEIYPGISTAFLRASTGKKYTLSPAGRYIIWIGG